MNDSTTTRTQTLLCPFCEVYELEPAGGDSARCPSCRGFVDGQLLETLRQIAGLPDAVGSHACECGHPEMRRLPDGVFHCPACGSEVLPVEASDAGWKSSGHSEAYQAGWLDGRYGEAEPFTENRHLARWQGCADRLDYYRGHRAGREARTAAGERPLRAA